MSDTISSAFFGNTRPCGPVNCSDGITCNLLTTKIMSGLITYHYTCNGVYSISDNVSIWMIFFITFIATPIALLMIYGILIWCADLYKCFIACVVEINVKTKQRLNEINTNKINKTTTPCYH